MSNQQPTNRNDKDPLPLPANDFEQYNPLAEFGTPSAPSEFRQVQKHTDALWRFISSDQWRPALKEFNKIQAAPISDDAKQTVLRSTHPDTKQNILQTLLLHSAPVQILQVAIQTGVQFTEPAQVNDMLQEFANSDVDRALELRRHRQAVALVAAGAPVHFTDKDGNTLLMRVARQFNEIAEHGPRGVGVELANVTISQRPDLAGLRNIKNELPLCVFAELQAWSVVEQLAHCHIKEKAPSVNLDEVVLLRAWALAKDAPYAVLHALKQLHQKVLFCEPSSHTVSPLDQYRDSLLRSLQVTVPEEANIPDWRRFQSVLRFIEMHKDQVATPALYDLLNARVDDRTIYTASGVQYIPENGVAAPTVLQAAFLLNATPDTMQRLIELGADPTTTFSYKPNGSGSNPIECTLLHAVVCEEANSIWQVIPGKSALLNIPNSDGDLPVHMYAYNASSTKPNQVHKSAAWIKRVLEAQAEIEPLTQHGFNVADTLILGASFAVYDLLLDRLHLPRMIDPYRTYPPIDGHESDVMSAFELLAHTVPLLASANRSIATEAADIVYHGHDLYSLYLYAEAAKEIISGVDSDGAALLKLMPALLWSHQPAQVVELIGELEMRNDAIAEGGKSPVAHANEAELLLLFNHPGLSSLAPENVNFLTSALTSITRFIANPEVTLNDITTIENWARIGVATHSHQRYKYDSMTVATEGKNLPALLEEFGCRPVQPRDSDFSDDSSEQLGYGPGFLFRGKAFDGLQRSILVPGVDEPILFSEDTDIEFRRGYFMVTHPENGTLLVRNSSLHFGRDLFLHPAYYSSYGVGNGFTLSDVLQISPEMIRSTFRNILDRELNRNAAHSQQISFLLNQLKIVQAEFQAWKFDTNPQTAFLQQTKRDRPVLSPTGGWNAPGFKHLVDRLEAWQHTAPTRTPALAFVHPHLPPWNPHSFKDENGQLQTQLVVTPERLDVLKRIPYRAASLDDMLDTGILSFFQVAGMSTQGELVLLD